MAFLRQQCARWVEETERLRRKLFLFINAERGVHGHLASQFFSTRCARPYSFLAWAHLKRRLLSRLRKTEKKGEREATSRSCTIVAHGAKVHLTWQIHNSLTLCRVKRHPPRLTNGHWQMPVSEDSGAWSSTPSHSTFVSRGYVRYLRQRYLNRGVEFLDIVTVNRGYDVSRMVSRMVLKYIKFGNCLAEFFKSNFTV